MSTVVLNAYQSAYPLITNRLRATVATQTSPSTPVASQIQLAPHSIRTWNFSGLPRANYSFSLDEIDAGGGVVNNLALFAVVPGEAEGMTIRGDEQIKVDTTNGFASGATGALFEGDTFIGVNSRPDYRGWDIVPSELDGRGILKKDLDYSWNKITGQFQLLQTGDILQTGTYYNIHFNPIVNPAGNSVPITPFDSRHITNTESLQVSDFGKVITVEPTGSYIELTLPLLSSVPLNTPMKIEVSNTTVDISIVKCVKFIKSGSDTIKFLRGNLYALCGESFWIYGYSNPVSGLEWRLSNVNGNFARVGQFVSDDLLQSFGQNRIGLNGINPIGDVFQHARIYNEVVLNLQVSSVVNYDDWLTGNNRRYFSLANSASPSNNGKFRFPDRGDLFEMNNLSQDSGDYLVSQNKLHGHAIRTTSGLTSGNDTADPMRGTFPGSVNSRGLADSNGVGDKSIESSGASVARPETVCVNRYVSSRKRTIRFGTAYGLPDYLYLKVADAIALDNLKIENVNYVIEGEDSITPSDDVDGHPLYYYNVNMTLKTNTQGAVFAGGINSDKTGVILVVDATAFGMPAGSLINIEVDNG